MGDRSGTKIPELVYRGKKEVMVKADVADFSKVKFKFRLLGLNFQLGIDNIEFDKDGFAKL